MEPNDMLSSLLSDPQKLQSAISMASSLLGGGGMDAAPMPGPSAPEPMQEEAQSAGSFDAPPMSEPAAAPAFSMPSFGMPQRASSSANYDPSAELMSKAMPVISAIARSGQTAVSREKSNLLNSIKPFVSGTVGGQLDHAMRLVSVARMARSAMSQIGGSARSSDSNDGTREL